MLPEWQNPVAQSLPSEQASPAETRVAEQCSELLDDESQYGAAAQQSLREVHDVEAVQPVATQTFAVHVPLAQSVPVTHAALLAPRVLPQVNANDPDGPVQYGLDAQHGCDALQVVPAQVATTQTPPVHIAETQSAASTH